MPPAAQHHTKAGAIAFAKYYWRVANYAQRTLDPAPLRALQDGHCNECSGGERFITEVRKRGGTIHGGTTSVTSAVARPTESASGRWMTVSFHMRATAQLIDLPGSDHDK